MSNYHYKRLNKLFRSNFVTPQFLVNSKYKFNYNLNSSMQDWKKIILMTGRIKLKNYFNNNNFLITFVLKNCIECFKYNVDIQKNCPII